MKKISFLIGLVVIVSGLSGCAPEPTAEYVAPVAAVEQTEIEPPVKTIVTDLSLDKATEKSFNCTLNPQTVTQLGQAVAQKSTKALKGINLQSTSPEYLMASELITGKPAQVSFYDREKFNFCVLGK